MRKKRKKEHVENFLKTSYEGDTLFQDIYLEHNALPELNFNEIDTSTNFLGKTIDYPLIINAMTGGSEFAQDINRDLAKLAREFNIPMAVGSETIILCDGEYCKESFKIVRETIGENGIVISNLSGQASLEDAKKALEIIDGNAIQIHLNVAQELSMEEGDRDFKGIIKNIENLVKNCEKPIIVKEVGFGISKDVARRLYDIGVRYIDVSGHGGTNFIEIENLRNLSQDLAELYPWGIPTALSLVNCKGIGEDLNLISSGGIKNSTDIAKSLVLGAQAVGISGELLSYLNYGGYDNARKYLEGIVYKLKMIMLLMGKKNIEELRNSEYKIIGNLRELV